MKKVAIVLIIIIAVILVAIGIIILYDQFVIETTPTMEAFCVNKGCPERNIYIGSINSDKYYACDCYYADTILPENIICFSTDSEAIEMGYTKSDC